MRTCVLKFVNIFSFFISTSVQWHAASSKLIENKQTEMNEIKEEEIKKGIRSSNAAQQQILIGLVFLLFTLCMKK